MDTPANVIAKSLRAAKREAAKKARAFDGRFSARVEVDQKKETNKRLCRGKVKLEDY